MTDLKKIATALKEAAEMAANGTRLERSGRLLVRTPGLTPIRTGEICPESGVWVTMQEPITTAPVAKGDIMPSQDGSAVSWKLVQQD